MIDAVSQHKSKAKHNKTLQPHPPLMRQVALNLTVVAAALICSGVGINAFTIASPVLECKHAPSLPSSSMLMSSSSDESTVVLVNQEAFVRAIDILKNDMGMERITDGQRPMYAIGKLVARLPLELVSGIRFADCETLTLISQLKESVVEETGIQSLDTIVAIRAGGDGRGCHGYEGCTNGASIADTAQAYTDAIKYAMQNNLKDIELEINRLVPLIPTTE
jgi:hypothetical protein